MGTGGGFDVVGRWSAPFSIVRDHGIWWPPADGSIGRLYDPSRTVTPSSPGLVYVTHSWGMGRQLLYATPVGSTIVVTTPTGSTTRWHVISNAVMDERTQAFGELVTDQAGRQQLVVITCSSPTASKWAPYKRVVVALPES